MAVTNSPPLEVISGPVRAYIAPVGTVFPLVTVAESAIDAAWVLIGTSGDLNLDRAAGVTVTHSQDVTKWRSAGDGGSRKAFRVSEDMMVKFKLVDFSLEQYKHALNGNAVTLSPGQRKIGLSRGATVRAFALLVRSDQSPYADQENSQYEVPRCFEGGSPEVAMAKPGEPAGYDLQFEALVDPDATDESERFGRLVVEDSSIT